MSELKKSGSNKEMLDDSKGGIKMPSPVPDVEPLGKDGQLGVPAGEGLPGEQPGVPAGGENKPAGAGPTAPGEQPGPGGEPAKRGRGGLSAERDIPKALILTLYDSAWDDIMEGLELQAEQYLDREEIESAETVRELIKSLVRLGADVVGGRIQGYKLKMTSGQKHTVEIRVVVESE